jgi:hypothetical protein
MAHRHLYLLLYTIGFGVVLLWVMLGMAFGPSAEGYKGVRNLFY